MSSINQFAFIRDCIRANPLEKLIVCYKKLHETSDA